jgi:hypothetical protein
MNTNELQKCFPITLILILIFWFGFMQIRCIIRLDHLEKHAVAQEEKLSQIMKLIIDNQK